MTIAEVKDIATMAGVLVGVTSLVFTMINTRITAKTNRARFWLDLRKQMSEHNEVHINLRPRGAWAPDKGDPQGPSNGDWPKVEAYMGLFEHCEAMLRERLIDEETFKAIYRYRLVNIMGNPLIRDYLKKYADGWKGFLALLKRMKIEVK